MPVITSRSYKTTPITPPMWTERTTALTASDATAQDHFGYSLSLSDGASVMAVGAYAWDGAGGSDQGSVYVFDWNGSSWVERAQIVSASDAGTGDLFGSSVSLSDDASVMAIGALGWDGATGSNQGVVYVFDWNGSAWIERPAALIPSDPGVSDFFGAAVSLSDDASVLAVGSSGWDGATVNNQGAVYVFDWNGSAWIERTTALTPSDAGNGDRFGESVSLSDDASVMAIGANAWDGATVNNQGAVYVFDWNGSAWIERTTALTPSDAEASDLFGSSVSLSDNASVMAIGAYAWDGAAGSIQGAVYVFDYS